MTNYVNITPPLISQGFIFNRQLLVDVYVPNHYTLVNSNFELISGDVYLLGDAELILL